MCSYLTIIHAQDYYIYVGREKRYFETSPDKIIVQFDKTTTGLDKNALQKKTSYLLSNVSATDSKGLNLISFSNTDKTSLTHLVTQWKNRDAILYSGHVFIDRQGKEIAAMTNQLIVKLKNKNDYTVLEKSIKPYDINKIVRTEFDSSTYLLSLNYSSEKNAMQIANELYETGLFDYAEPDLMLFINYETNDTYFPQQWALKNTGQNGGASGIDIKVEQAWTVTTGSPNIKIAILDSGVDLTHPDLENNLLTGYDATGGNNNGNHSGVGHGTACAGIVAARGNNGVGVAGVAYNCRI
jgi:subtilisin family serine protease